MRWRMGVLLWTATAIVAAISGCGTDVFTCAQDGECHSGSAAGTCQASGYCSFPDDGCPSGQRYGDLAGAGLDGSCVVDEPATTSDDGSGGGSSSTGVQPGTETLPSTTSTTSESQTGSESSTGGSGTSAPDTCGDGVVQGAEQCDDGNDDNTDACTVLCTISSCSDGFQNGTETDVDCGGACNPCADGAACKSDTDCEGGACASGTCTTEMTRCADLPPDAPSGVYSLPGPRGEGELEVYCDNERAGGGWTLAMVASDDGTATWTYENRDVFTNAETFGSPQTRHLDMKSFAASTLTMRDLLFVHAPSDQWASYEDVGDASATLTEFIAGYPTLTCSDTEEGSFPLSEGTIAVKGGLCDTRLYFNRGDLDGTQQQCEGAAEGSPQNTFGPCFSRSNNSPCPFDDPDGSGFGPNQQIPGDEEAGLGFGRALGLNTGEASTGENHLMLFVR